jgi:CRP-like cAMP-binding protein/CheY-like chemotaxis protein
MQVQEILQQVPFFKTLSESDIETIVKRLEFKTFVPSTYVCKINEPGDKMFIIISGAVKVCIYDADNQEQVVAKLEAGNYFGEMALLTDEPRTASVITTDPSEMFILHQKDFNDMLDLFPSIQIELGKIMSKRLRQNLAKAMEMSKKAASKKIEQKTASGRLSPTKSLADIMGFCDQKNLTGDILIENNGQKGTLTYDAGQIIKVKLGTTEDDEALDQLLDWEGGTFKIIPREVSFDELIGGDESSSEDITLVVSNSLVVRKLLERKLSSMGKIVKTARNISSAIDIINQSSPSMVIADMKFDDGNAANLGKGMREKSNCPMIVISDGKVSSDIIELAKTDQNVKVTNSHDLSEVTRFIELLN